MEERIYDYWAATLQDGYIGNLIELVNKAGGAHALYDMKKEDMSAGLGISARLADYIDAHRADEDLIRADYYRMMEQGISYVNHTEPDYPEKLREIPGRPYGLFVRGCLPDPLTPSVAIVGARECTEYGRLMAEYLGDRLAKEGVQIISGMAWGIDGIAQTAALNSGGRSYAVSGCGVDITYPARNRILYSRLCENGNGIISEYAPGTPAESRRFPPRNRLISGLCDVLIVVEARVKSGTRITVDMAIDQGRTVMIVPGRLTDSLSAGCLNLLYQGALPVTGIESVLEQLGVKGSGKNKEKEVFSVREKRNLPKDLDRVYNVLTLSPQSIDEIARRAHIPVNTAMVILTRLEMEGAAKEIGSGFFVIRPDPA